MIVQVQKTKLLILLLFSHTQTHTYVERKINKYFPWNMLPNQILLLLMLLYCNITGDAYECIQMKQVRERKAQDIYLLWYSCTHYRKLGLNQYFHKLPGLLLTFPVTRDTESERERERKRKEEKSKFIAYKFVLIIYDKCLLQPDTKCSH